MPIENDEDTLSIADLVGLAYNDQPARVQDAFDAVIASKIQDIVGQKKVEVAQAMFGDKEEITYDDDEDFGDDESEEDTGSEEE